MDNNKKIINGLEFSIVAILFSLFGSVFISCRSTSKKIKTQTIIQYWYKAGEPDASTADSTIVHYNRLGLVENEISDGRKATYKYLNDTLLESETVYGLRDNIIWHKKNITYNEKGEPKTIRIYESFTHTKTPELVSGMDFFYDQHGRLHKKKYFGPIDLDENELMATVSMHIVNNEEVEDEPMDIRVKKRIADSTTATYVYDDTGRISRIYFNGDTANCFSFLYNRKGQLVQKQLVRKFESYLAAALEYCGGKGFSGTKYIYSDQGRQVVEYCGGLQILITSYDKDGRLMDRTKFKNSKQMWKVINKHTTDGELVETVELDEINEPKSKVLHFYDYY